MSQTESYINWGLNLNKVVNDYLLKNPSPQQIKALDADINTQINQVYERDLKTAWESDKQALIELPNNPWPNYAQDRVYYLKKLVIHVIESGGSVISNKQWIYDDCMATMKKID